MINKVTLIGNLGRDPEVRSTQSGQSVAIFSMATHRKWRDRDGSRQEQTEWHNIICWGRLAEVAGQYLVRGKKVYVEGRLQTSSWEDRQSGEKKYRTEVVCESLQMFAGRDEVRGNGEYGSGDSTSRTPPQGGIPESSENLHASQGFPEDAPTPG